MDLSTLSALFWKEPEGASNFCTIGSKRATFSELAYLHHTLDDVSEAVSPARILGFSAELPFGLRVGRPACLRREVNGVAASKEAEEELRHAPGRFGPERLGVGG